MPNPLLGAPCFFLRAAASVDRHELRSARVKRVVHYAYAGHWYCALWIARRLDYLGNDVSLG